jgi:hypothetical protein
VIRLYRTRMTVLSLLLMVFCIAMAADVVSTWLGREPLGTGSVSIIADSLLCTACHSALLRLSDRKAALVRAERTQDHQ